MAEDRAWATVGALKQKQDKSTLNEDVSSLGYVKDASLATVARTGSYNDLSNKPTIPAAQIQSDWNQTDNTKKDFIKNKPTIPDAKTIFDICHPVNSLIKFDRATDMSQYSNGTWVLAYQGKIGGTTTTELPNNLFISKDNNSPILHLTGEDETQIIALFSKSTIGEGGTDTADAEVYCSQGVIQANENLRYKGGLAIGGTFTIDLSKASGAIDVYIYKRTA